MTRRERELLARLRASLGTAELARRLGVPAASLRRQLSTGQLSAAVLKALGRLVRRKKKRAGKKPAASQRRKKAARKKTARKVRRVTAAEVASAARSLLERQRLEREIAAGERLGTPERYLESMRERLGALAGEASKAPAPERPPRPKRPPRAPKPEPVRQRLERLERERVLAERLGAPNAVLEPLRREIALLEVALAPPAPPTPPEPPPEPTTVQVEPPRAPPAPPEAEEAPPESEVVPKSEPTPPPPSEPKSEPREPKEPPKSEPPSSEPISEPREPKEPPPEEPEEEGPRPPGIWPSPGQILEAIARGYMTLSNGMVVKTGQSGGRPVRKVRFDESGRLLGVDYTKRPVRGYVVVDTKKWSFRVMWTDRGDFKPPAAGDRERYEALYPREYEVHDLWLDWAAGDEAA